MDLTELQIFLQLSTTLHFGRTAEQCYLSPSAVSRAIQRLEEEVGVPLLLRDNRGVELTPEGECFRAFAADTLAGWDNFRERIAREGIELAGEVKLFCTVTACYSFLPSLLSSFHDAYPKIHLKLQTGDAAQAVPQVLEERVDLSIAPLPNTLPDSLAFRRLVETSLVFIIPRREGAVRALFTQGPVDYAQVPMVLAETELSRRRINAWFDANGITPQIYALVAGNEAIIAMVSLGLGAGVLPRLVAETSPLRDQIEVYPIDPPLEPYIIGLCAMKRRLASPFVRAFWEKARYSEAG